MRRPPGRIRRTGRRTPGRGRGRIPGRGRAPPVDGRGVGRGAGVEGRGAGAGAGDDGRLDGAGEDTRLPPPPPPKLPLAEAEATTIRKARRSNPPTNQFLWIRDILPFML